MHTEEHTSTYANVKKEPKPWNAENLPSCKLVKKTQHDFRGEYLRCFGLHLSQVHKSQDIHICQLDSGRASRALEGIPLLDF